MSSIAVTGAGDAVGRRLVRQLAADAAVERVIAIDRRRPPSGSTKVESHAAVVGRDDLSELLETCDTLVHLAPEASRGGDADLVAATSEVLFEQAATAGCRHIVLLSSATVYGARADNPIPITESEPPAVTGELSFAVAKLAAERVLEDWAAGAGAGAGAGTGERSIAIMRPTITLSEHGAGWVAKAVRSASVVRPDQIDPPVQFLHRDDLASALSLAARRQLTGYYNVAPDSWIGASVFRELRGDLPVRLPGKVADRARWATRRAGVRPVPDGIDDYVAHPWVIANDRLRAQGWIPAFSNEEAFVLGTPAPPWSISPQRRQEVALGVASAAVAGATAAAVGLAKRVTR